MEGARPSAEEEKSTDILKHKLKGEKVFNLAAPLVAAYFGTEFSFKASIKAPRPEKECSHKNMCHLVFLSQFHVCHRVLLTIKHTIMSHVPDLSAEVSVFTFFSSTDTTAAY